MTPPIPQHRRCYIRSLVCGICYVGAHYAFELSEDERAKFRELAKPVRQTFIDDVGERGKKALDIVLEQADKSGDAD